MSIRAKKFKVTAGATVDLRSWPTRVAPFYSSEDDYHRELALANSELRKKQQRFYVADRSALLLILQGTDASGKDGIVRHVFESVNPQGCSVTSFGPPSDTELRHDFLWRTTKALPERRHIGIFNRSYYEEVFIVRVHHDLLRARMPVSAEKPADLWKGRFDSINDHEKHLHRNGTRMVKIFLHLSKGEQRRRFLERTDAVDKHWKIGAADIRERRYWKEYRHAYERALEATSTEHAPWYIVPADDKPNARLIVSRIILDTLGSLDLSVPEPTAAQRRELKRARRELAR